MDSPDSTNRHSMRTRFEYIASGDMGAVDNIGERYTRKNPITA
jgi:hypothetical protein